MNQQYSLFKVETMNKLDLNTAKNFIEIKFVILKIGLVSLQKKPRAKFGRLRRYLILII